MKRESDSSGGLPMHFAVQMSVALGTGGPQVIKVRFSLVCLQYVQADTDTWVRRGDCFLLVLCVVWVQPTWPEFSFSATNMSHLKQGLEVKHFLNENSFSSL